MLEFETVVGVEVHVELGGKIRTKVFCSCPITHVAPPNTATCPVCLGFPGVLPVLNESVVEAGLKVALALNAKINHLTKFDRKAYFYPDLPKNFQISQRHLPLAYDGWLDIEVNGKTKRIRIADVHIEEDTGKSIHAQDGGFEYSLIDYNRSGVPLVEIITEPDMNSLEEVEAYMTTLRQILLYLGVSECRMELGQMRLEASVSLRPKGETKLGTRVEVKNLNSFKAVLGALRAEVRRQEELLKRGEPVRQATVLWNEAKSITEIMRIKETPDDYRYFPEPDLVPILIDEAWLDRIRASLPELHQARRQRFIEQYGLPEYDARILTASKPAADFFEKCVKLYVGAGLEPAATRATAKSVSNWMLSDLQGLLNAEGKEWQECPIRPEQLVGMLKLIEEGTITGRIAKDVLPEIYRTGKDAQTIVHERGLVQLSDESELLRIITEIVDANPKVVEEFKKGREKSMGFIVGQVMRTTGGRANPQLVNKLVRQVLQGR